MILYINIYVYIITFKLSIDTQDPRIYNIKWQFLYNAMLNQKIIYKCFFNMFHIKKKMIIIYNNITV